MLGVYGCETYLLILKEGGGQDEKVFVFEREAVTGDWRKLREELQDFYCKPNNIQAIRSQRMRRVGHVARMEDNRNV